MKVDFDKLFAGLGLWPTRPTNQEEARSWQITLLSVSATFSYQSLTQVSLLLRT